MNSGEEDAGGAAAADRDHEDDDDDDARVTGRARLRMDCGPKHQVMPKRSHLLPPPSDSWEWRVVVLMKDKAAAAGNAMVRVFGRRSGSSPGSTADADNFVFDGVFMCERHVEGWLEKIKFVDSDLNRSTTLADLDSKKRFVTNVDLVPLVNALMLAKWTNFMGESEVAAAFDKVWSSTKHTRIEINMASMLAAVFAGLAVDNNPLESRNGQQKDNWDFKKLGLCAGVPRLFEWLSTMSLRDQEFGSNMNMHVWNGDFMVFVHKEVRSRSCFALHTLLISFPFLTCLSPGFRAVTGEQPDRRPQVGLHREGRLCHPVDRNRGVTPDDVQSEARGQGVASSHAPIHRWRQLVVNVHEAALS